MAPHILSLPGVVEFPRELLVGDGLLCCAHATPIPLVAVAVFVAVGKYHDNVGLVDGFGLGGGGEGRWASLRRTPTTTINRSRGSCSSTTRYNCTSVPLFHRAATRASREREVSRIDRLLGWQFAGAVSVRCLVVPPLRC